LAQEPGLPAPDEARTKRLLLNSPDVDAPEDGRRRVLQLARLATTAEFYGRVAPKLQRRFGADLLGVYFELIDACSHAADGTFVVEAHDRMDGPEHWVGRLQGRRQDTLEQERRRGTAGPES
jgi:hypothetical protein